MRSTAHWPAAGSTGRAARRPSRAASRSPRRRSPRPDRPRPGGRGHARGQGGERLAASGAGPRPYPRAPVDERGGDRSGRAAGAEHEHRAPAESSPASARLRRKPSPSVESPQERAVGAQHDRVHRRRAPSRPASSSSQARGRVGLVRHRDAEAGDAEHRAPRARRRRPSPGATSSATNTQSSPVAAYAALWIAGEREWRTGSPMTAASRVPPGDHGITAPSARRRRRSPGARRRSSRTCASRSCR